MTDPGEEFVWGESEKNHEILKRLEIKEESKLVLIKRYLDIETIPIPPGGTPVHQNNLLVDLDLGSQPRSRSNSHSGSVDSDENNSIGSSGSTKDKDKEKSKVAKQMQTVAKSFGSIGKTMSKKLKKNFGGVGKTMKAEEKLKEKKKMRRTSVGSVTQSTKVTSVTAEMLRDKEHILCVRLSHKRMEYQEEMVRNYLLAAQERFKQDREIRRQQDVEMRLKVELRSSREVLNGALTPSGDTVDGGGILSPRMQCINTGCDAKGSASTSYLCPPCYEKEKQQALDFERGPVAADGRPILGGAAMPLERQDTLMTCGKSKFYTLSDDDHYGNVSHVNLAAQKLQHPPLPSNKREVFDNSELNNAKLLRDKKNSYINNGMKIARSTFYEDVAGEYKPSGGSSTTTSTTTTTTSTTAPVAPKPSLPAGTAYIVNDLHHQPHRGPTSGVAQPSNERLFGMVTSCPDTSLEPPLRPEFQPQSEANIKQTVKIQVAPPSAGDSVLKSMVVGGHGSVLQTGPIQQKCRTIDCPFYGTNASDFLCSACYRKKQQVPSQTTAKTQVLR